MAWLDVSGERYKMEDTRNALFIIREAGIIEIRLETLERIRRYEASYA